MTHQDIATGAGWVPDVCTLPTADRPLRLAEFDRFFAGAVRAAQRVSAQHLRLWLDNATQVEETARELTARESSCCSFFAFDLSRPDPDSLTLEVRVPAGHVDVLDALAERAAAVRRQR
ncbi:hypothetical protein GCM10029963_44350 [Micromonospora andamanensis]|uniref:hypothetical protein n=1 Tax=Micromonospora andamanensis TaxID=1287068 RepID=UPI0019503AB7|nr:hypothetical protein [Micromonospora andamanensis]GIJ39391.1 hypothetical protein Vwe01_27160 [Micromonospora andamanensis]